VTTLSYASGLGEDVERIVAHLVSYGVQAVDERVAGVFEALWLLTQHPLIGRPVDTGERELVIGEGSRGYVALYRYDPLDDAVEVVGLRAQREAGFRDR
jgi:toxin ParE1/3/4